ncbi:MAG: hypothetical protein R2713_12200 [Ilumatobacteraceae bacterium]|nr:hypothetical protein [Acidimicrobiales bacterium]MCB9392247.1 hypothetical protein [Acidimicrobiaceae bacterium]
MLYLVLIACIASIVAYVKLKQGEVIRFDTPAPPQHVVMTSVAQVGTARRWTTATQTDTNVAFNYHKRPNTVVVIVLLLFGIIPGVVYWMLRSKREALNVMMTASAAPGLTTVQIVSNGYQGKSAGRAVRAALGVSPTAAVTTASTQALPAPRGAFAPPATPLPSPADRRHDAA